uniref:HECT domain-containing protein n=1 Tax=Macrostomum lignano TaxID=282301 RepID=A0A1I8FD34_9PLAT
RTQTWSRDSAAACWHSAAPSPAQWPTPCLAYSECAPVFRLLYSPDVDVRREGVAPSLRFSNGRNRFGTRSSRNNNKKQSKSRASGQRSSGNSRKKKQKKRSKSNPAQPAVSMAAIAMPPQTIILPGLMQPTGSFEFVQLPALTTACCAAYSICYSPIWLSQNNNSSGRIRWLNYTTVYRLCCDLHRQVLLLLMLDNCSLFHLAGTGPPPVLCRAEEPLRLACLEAVGQAYCANLAADCQGQAQGQTLPPASKRFGKIPAQLGLPTSGRPSPAVNSRRFRFPSPACAAFPTQPLRRAFRPGIAAGVSADGAWGLGLALLRPGAIAGCSPLVRAQACDLLASLIAASAAAAGSGTDAQKRLASESSQLVSSFGSAVPTGPSRSCRLAPLSFTPALGLGGRHRRRLYASIAGWDLSTIYKKSVLPNAEQIASGKTGRAEVTSLLIGLLDPGLLEQCAPVWSAARPSGSANLLCASPSSRPMLACDDLRFGARDCCTTTDCLPAGTAAQIALELGRRLKWTVGEVVAGGLHNLQCCDCGLRLVKL